jgi:hypothetical protein
MRTASRILGFSVSAVMLSTVFLGGTAHAEDNGVTPSVTVVPAVTVVTVSCSDNLNWDGCSS